MTRKAPKPPAPDTCAYCYGKGLSLYWDDHGCRVPIGSPLTRTGEPAIPCDRCGKSDNYGQKRT